MTAAVSTMIINSLINLNERAIGSTLTAAEGTYYLAKMNTMLESWGLERLMVQAIQQDNFSLTANTGSYTIGVGAAFSATRPTKIIKAFIRDSDNSDTDVQVITFDRFAAIIDKNVTGSYPEYLYYDQNYDASGFGSIQLYPLPKAGLSLYIESYKQFESFAHLSTAMLLGPGYQRAIESNFTIEIAPGLGPISPELAKIARESKAAIKGINLPDTVMMLDAGIVKRRSGSILTGP